MQAMSHPGIQAALGAALLFGLATPLAKLLIGGTDPFLLAGLLYLGSGLGLAVWRFATRAPVVHLPVADRPWLAAAVLSGGVIGPVLLLTGLAGMGASEASLLLNAEAVFTTLIAWFAFRENFDARIAAGMAAITAGALLLATAGRIELGAALPSLLVLGACLAWGIDNNLTRRLSLSDASWIASVKGLVAGTVNLMLAVSVGAKLPDPMTIFGAMALGFFAYGVSLTLFIHALRDLGTARASAWFGTAPFFGAIFALALGEPLTAVLLVAACLMALGLWLHATESHEHEHTHPELEHAHWHRHDIHHQHDHPWAAGRVFASGERHFHKHRHATITHAHPHFPDAHHRHRHN